MMAFQLYSKATLAMGYIFGCVFLLSTALFSSSISAASEKSTKPSSLISEATQDCLSCHEDETSGIISDWCASRHVAMSVKNTLLKPMISR